jgi:hypothetical protein
VSFFILGGGLKLRELSCSSSFQYVGCFLGLNRNVYICFRFDMEDREAEDSEVEDDEVNGNESEGKNV